MKIQCFGGNDEREISDSAATNENVLFETIRAYCYGCEKHHTFFVVD